MKSLCKLMTENVLLKSYERSKISEKVFLKTHYTELQKDTYTFTTITTIAGIFERVQQSLVGWMICILGILTEAILNIYYNCQSN